MVWKGLGEGEYEGLNAMKEVGGEQRREVQALTLSWEWVHLTLFCSSDIGLYCCCYCVSMLSLFKYNAKHVLLYNELLRLLMLPTDES